MAKVQHTFGGGYCPACDAYGRAPDVEQPREDSPPRKPRRPATEPREALKAAAAAEEEAKPRRRPAAELLREALMDEAAAAEEAEEAGRQCVEAIAELNRQMAYSFGVPPPAVMDEAKEQLVRWPRGTVRVACDDDGVTYAYDAGGKILRAYAPNEAGQARMARSVTSERITAEPVTSERITLPAKPAEPARRLPDPGEHERKLSAAERVLVGDCLDRLDRREPLFITREHGTGTESEWHSDWRKARREYVLTGDAVALAVMADYVTEDNPVLAADVARAEAANRSGRTSVSAIAGTIAVYTLGVIVVLLVVLALRGRL